MINIETIEKTLPLPRGDTNYRLVNEELGAPPSPWAAEGTTQPPRPKKALVVLPSVCMARDGDGLFMDIKAVEGLRLYAKAWPGPVKCLMRLGHRGKIAYGQTYAAADLPFSVEVIPDDLDAHPALFADAAVILASGDNHRDLNLANVTSTPVVFIIEYTLATRLRIHYLDHGLSFQTLKSLIWIVMTERKRRAAFALASGLQANGVPAYKAYRAIARATLLYFDNRVRAAQQATIEQIADKAAHGARDRPLRLAFSGRLERLKGADQLIPVIKALAARGLDFTFDIFGDGSLRQEMECAVDTAGLGGRVMFHGPVSFDAVLVPYLKRHIDLFVCCHRQSDPSCTYIETLACGVPIIGYDNAAFRGVTGLGPVGKYVPMGRADRLAAAIVAFDRDRLAAMAYSARKVSLQHSFEATFARRVEHLAAIAALWWSCREASIA